MIIYKMLFESFLKECALRLLCNFKSLEKNGAHCCVSVVVV